MYLDEAARHSGLFQGSSLQAFLDWLHQEPETPPLLVDPHPDEERLQGDLVDGMPFAIIDAGGAARRAVFTVAVVNNTCDLQPGRSEFITVVPVFEFSAFEGGIRRGRRNRAAAADFLHSVKQNKVYEILYLADCPGFREGAVILLERMSAVSSNLYSTALSAGRRVASFSQNGFYYFLIRLTKYFARPETEEVQRI